MAKTATLNIRIDQETKQDVETLFKRFGLTISDAINIFLQQSLMADGLPFEMRQPRFNAETEAAIQEADDIIAGKIQAKRYSSFREFLTDMEDENAGI